MTRPPSSLVWFRADLRLEDNPALEAAVRRGGPVIPVFVWAPEEEEPWAPGGSSRWWLHHSLAALDRSLRERKSRLVLRKGPSERALRELVRETGAEAVFWNRRCEPAVAARDRKVEEGLRKQGIEASSSNGSLLAEPWEIETKTGGPYQVFTPFGKALLDRPEPVGITRAPEKIAPPRTWPKSPGLGDLGLLPGVDRAAGMGEAWTPGEEGAVEALHLFLKEGAAEYETGRDRPDRVGTSRLSPHLHFGEIGPRQVWVHARRAAARERTNRLDPAPWLRQIAWREFAHHLLHHFPSTPEKPLRPAFAKFPWRRGKAALGAWERGETGFPIVDAGMRELRTTGWMHNRVRMIVASFLTKDLLIPWREGARWFWENLVDADLANNTFGWQWTAGCGADAAPYFRIFNPVSQGERFDPEGVYVRRRVPEIGALPDKYVHRPWEAPPALLRDAGVALGRTYPKPMVDHGEARKAALAAYDKIKSEGNKR
ncbi:MAG: deoxyribodipyrimidine photo-lyase [Candidatus Eisenbacteria bacterium]